MDRKTLLEKGTTMKNRHSNILDLSNEMKSSWPPLAAAPKIWVAKPVRILSRKGSSFFMLGSYEFQQDAK